MNIEDLKENEIYYVMFISGREWIFKFSHFEKDCVGHNGATTSYGNYYPKSWILSEKIYFNSTLRKATKKEEHYLLNIAKSKVHFKNYNYVSDLMFKTCI